MTAIFVIQNSSKVHIQHHFLHNDSVAQTFPCLKHEILWEIINFLQALILSVLKSADQKNTKTGSYAKNINRKGNYFLTLIIFDYDQPSSMVFKTVLNITKQTKDLIVDI